MRIYFLNCLFLVSLGILPLTVDAQTNLETTTKRAIGLRIGVLHSGIQDSRLSAKTFRGYSSTFGIRIEGQKPKYWHTTTIDFTSLKANPQEVPLSLSSVLTSVHSSFRWKYGAAWLGGQTTHTTLLNFPWSRQDFFNNNPISYTIAQSIGPSLGYQASPHEKLTLQAAADASMWSYVIQPIFGHPYPQQYLEPEVFSPTRARMAGPLIRSGKLVGPKRFRQFRMRLALCYQFSNHWKLDLEWQHDRGYANTQGKPVRWSNQQLTLTTSYTY